LVIKINDIFKNEYELKKIDANLNYRSLPAFMQALVVQTFVFFSIGLHIYRRKHIQRIIYAVIEDFRDILKKIIFI
jgi:hypothetical protein